MRSYRNVWIILLFAVAAPLGAQESDVLTGRVTTADGKPLSGVRVEAVSAETEITRTSLTDSDGRFLILFPDGGGSYLMRFSRIGMADVVRPLTREAEEELLVSDVVMEPWAIALDPIEVVASRRRPPPPGDARAGEQSTTLPQELLNQLPLPDLDPATVALLAAGVIGTGIDSISGKLGFSVAGMSELLNQVTLDGVIMGHGGAGVPEEGTRSTSITTSTFDASRGGFAGGMVSMASARGNNRAGGALSYRMDSDALQSTVSPTTNAFTLHHLSGSFGGPIIANKLFYNAAAQISSNTQHRFALAANDPLAALRSGVAADSISRFLDILAAQHGIDPVGQTGAYNQQSDDIRLQGRMDWNILQRPTGSQTLSVRANTNLNAQDTTRISQLDLLQRGGETERNSVMAAATLTSRFRNNWTNTLNLSFSENWSEAMPFVEMPEGRVRVTSEFDDGASQTSQVAFGGNRSMPADAYSRDVQFSSNMSLLQPIGDQLHRFKVGGSAQHTKDIARSTDNLFGTFTYASLADFQENRPERFERSLSERQSRTGALMTGLYIGDTWRVSNPFELTLGLRWDRTELDQTPQHNPIIEELFGLRTDLTPTASAISPRLGFNYRLNEQGQPPRALSGGVGVFAGRAPTSIFSAAVRQTGLPEAEQRLTCIGDAVPFPDWDLYQQNPLAVPTLCADESLGQQSTRAPDVTVISPDQSLPSSVRAELGYRTQLPLQVNGNFRYTYSRGMGLWGYRDLNIDESDAFTIAGEDRPFFGDAAAIVERTGATSFASSRLHSEFGNVFEVVTDRESEAHQLSATLGGWLPGRVMFNANYTLSFARDQGSGGMGGGGLGMTGGGGGGMMGGGGMGFPATAGSPNDVEWAPASGDRRHTANLMLSYPITSWLELTGMTRLSSGAPFTPMVSSDINGDGLRNDRAFIFDPLAPGTDPQIAAAMDRLLESAPDRVRQCLAAQIGSIAGRNSCRNSWTQSLDMRLSLRPNLPALDQRFTIAADFRNVLTGIDQLVNGRGNMQGWGEGQRADPTLLEVRGFDAAANRFTYEVNEGFGQALRGPNSFRNAFGITLAGRIAIGGNPAMNNRGFGQTPGVFAGMGGMGGSGGMVMGGGGGMMMGGGHGGAGVMVIRDAAGGEPIVIGGAGGIGDIVRLFGNSNPGADSVMATIFANPVAEILGMRDSLALTPEQVTALSALRDTLDDRHALRREVVEPTVEEISDAIGIGGRITMQVMGPLRDLALNELMPNVEGARRETAEAMLAAQGLLQPAQWERLPAALRETQRQGAGGFNAVGVLDRMLANPLPVLLELKDTLDMTAEQVAGIEEIAARLDDRLNRLREELGSRFDDVAADQVMFVFQQMQPDIERGRNYVRAALREVERVLTRAQWDAVPRQIRRPYQQGGGR